jgi:hypothetical protein
MRCTGGTFAIFFVADDCRVSLLAERYRLALPDDVARRHRPDGDTVADRFQQVDLRSTGRVRHYRREDDALGVEKAGERPQPVQRHPLRELLVCRRDRRGNDACLAVDDAHMLEVQALHERRQRRRIAFLRRKPDDQVETVFQIDGVAVERLADIAGDDQMLVANPLDLLVERIDEDPAGKRGDGKHGDAGQGDEDQIAQAHARHPAAGFALSGPERDPNAAFTVAKNG